MNEISNKLIESLKIMGLAEYEAKVYATLVLFGRSEVKRIYEYLNVPKPSVYQSLKSLMNKGLVTMVSSRPAIYRAIPPEIALKHLIGIQVDAEKNALQELAKLENSSNEIEDINIIWTLFGENNVEHTMEELMIKARKSIKLALPTEYLNYLSFCKKDLEIELLVFTEDVSNVRDYNFSNITVHDGLEIDFSGFGDLYDYLVQIALPNKQYTKTIFIYIDDEELMYVPPYPEKTKPGITSKNPYLARLVNTIFGLIYEKTPELSLE